MSLCARCGAEFSCAMVDADPAIVAEACWCTLAPASFPVPDADAVAAGASCWCPACLRQRRAEASAETSAEARPVPATSITPAQK